MLGLWSEITKMIAEYLFYIFKLKNKFRVSTTQHFKMHKVQKNYYNWFNRWQNSSRKRRIKWD